jgi:hypothetical protein
MARVAAALVALVLIAVLTPASTGPVALARAVPVGHGAPAVPEEEAPREQRQPVESRSWSNRFAPAKNMKPPSCRVVPSAGRPPLRPALPSVERGRAEHLIAWSRPAALQVFRN